MHSLRLLLDVVPELLVEQRALPGARRAAAGDTMGQGFARRSHRRAARQSRGSVPALSLPHHHELRQGLPEEPQSFRGHCRTQAEDGRAPDVSAWSRLPNAAAVIARRRRTCDGLEGWTAFLLLIHRGSAEAAPPPPPHTGAPPARRGP